MRIRSNSTSAIVTIAFVLIAWFIINTSFKVPNYILPSPQKVFSVAVENIHSITIGTLNTTFTAIAGFFLAFAFGLVIGSIMFKSRLCYSIGMPAMVSAKSIPVIAVVPLVTLFLGVGWISKLTLTFLICFFPMTLSAYEGLQNISSGLEEFGHAVLMSSKKLLYKIKIPGAINQLILGMKITLPLAFVGSVVAEMSGGDEKGIGYIIIGASYRLNTPLLYASIFALSFASISAFYILSGLADLFLDHNKKKLKAK